MSVMLDTFWHWRATFGGWQSNPYATGGDDDPSTLAAHNQELGNSQWGFQNAPTAQLQGWSTSVPTSNAVFDNIPADFSYFPDSEWFTGMSFMDPMNMSVSQFDQQIQMSNDTMQ